MTRDPDDRCPDTNGGLRCVLRPHPEGPHIALVPEGNPAARVVPWPRSPVHASRAFTGDACSVCGSMRVVRTASCGTCLDCGESTGCG